MTMIKMISDQVYASKLSTFRNKNASSNSSKRLCETDWVILALLG
jgi:hypothetical protein